MTTKVAHKLLRKENSDGM